MSAEQSLLIEIRAAVATVTLNRPRARNALDRELVLALGDALARLAGDRSVRVVVLTGSGGAFCAGADLKKALAEAEGLAMSDRIDEFHRIITAIVSAPQPVIAAVDGAAVGFGADLALACDLRVFSTRAYLQEKFVHIGLMPDGGGTFWLPRLIGMGRAMEALLLGDAITAADALTLGLTNRVVEAEQLLGCAHDVANRMVQGAPLALTAIKRAVRDSLGGGLLEAMTREKIGQSELLLSDDFRAAVDAWSNPKTIDGASTHSLGR